MIIEEFGPAHWKDGKRLQATDPQREEVEALLGRILASPQFRRSERGKDFLKFVVEYWLAGKAQELKERTIGIEVFGRKPDYDVNEDAIVRIKAGDVRRRLAQYYQESETVEELRLQIPLGSYVPGLMESGPRSSPPVDTQFQQGFPAAGWAIVGLLLGIVAGGLAMAVSRHEPSPVAIESTGPTLRAFWQAALDAEKPILIQHASPMVYHVSHDDDGNLVPVPAPAQYVGFGDAVSGAHLAALFVDLDKSFSLRNTGSVSATDMRRQPTVLIGAFSNPWTLQLMRDQRFGFEKLRRVDGKPIYGVQDYQDPTRHWALETLQTSGDTTEDYAIITRLATKEAGRLLIALAGVTQYGTQAAGDFVVHESTLAAALKDAPPDWPRKSLQLVLRLPVIHGSPGTAEVVARHLW